MANVWTEKTITAYDLIESGKAIRLTRTGVLARLRGESVQVSGSDYTLRLTINDFLDLYGDSEATFLEERAGIDEKKDDAYYAWRREKQ